MQKGQFLGKGDRDVESLSKVNHSVFDSPVEYVNCGAGTIGCITKSGTLYVQGFTMPPMFERIDLPDSQRAFQVCLSYHVFTIVTSRYYI